MSSLFHHLLSSPPNLNPNSSSNPQPFQVFLFITTLGSHCIDLLKGGGAGNTNRDGTRTVIRSGIGKKEQERVERENERTSTRDWEAGGDRVRGEERTPTFSFFFIFLSSALWRFRPTNTIVCPDLSKEGERREREREREKGGRNRRLEPRWLVYGPQAQLQIKGHLVRPKRSLANCDTLVAHDCGTVGPFGCWNTSIDPLC
jgi:hypothetical protein